MEQKTFNYSTDVLKEWVDYNGHMNDAAYAQAFSAAVDSFMEYIGLDEKGRETYSYTIFTLETHLCYLLEASEGEKLDIAAQLLDTDEKRLHIFFNMMNADGQLVATSEQMLMGIDTETGKAAPFPSAFSNTIKTKAQADHQLEIPKQAGRTIGIRR
ncbi:thioesterase family protein [Sporosarcina ureae]|uniref:thioesterase family protein n=1 Tax=Sporosarcina ureae TaxID=1571 RepID=UPI0009DC5A47|nr:thioesterase family protein [Sporosarcina ureae]ARF16139.1 3-hydroxyacyl-CoA dehydrogenase [Sporosarcina ureae]